MATLTAVVDPNNLIEESNENNNSYSDELCWEFSPVPKCGYTNFWQRTYAPNETTQLSVGLRAEHLYKASEVKVRFEVSGPGIDGTQIVGDAVVENVRKLCGACPRVATLPNSFVFNEIGTYTFTMSADTDNEYSECNEGNNVLVKEVEVKNLPDMRILSQYINPTLLNPEADQAIFFDISYENIGRSNINDLMKLAVKVDNDILAEIPNVPGLIKNTIHTISVPVPYATDVEGMHVVRAIIDADNEIAELNELNNEATRSFVVGPAANLYFDSFEASSGPDPSPLPFAGGGFGGLPMTTFSNGSNGVTAIDALIKNNGDLDVVADVKFSYTANITDTIYLGTIQVDIPAGGSQLISHPWEELESSATVMGEIINVSELEFDTSDNFASTELNVFDVDITSINSCENQLGSLTVVASNGVPPYSYNWSNGYVGDVFEGGPGTYSVTVIDAEGTRAVATGTILEDPDCIEEVCSLSAMSFHVPNTCDPETGEYNTTLVVAYENAPAEGYLLVNGMEYEITGSPQSINVPFTSGNLVYEVSFSDNDDCALTVITGTSRDECMQDCEGNYGGNVLPGSSCEFSDGIPGIIDEDCNCIEVCQTPEISVSLVDANSGAIECVEEGGQYYVLVELIGGSSNDTYSLYDSGDALITEFTSGSNYLAGPYNEGDSVSFTAIGNQDDDCSVTSETIEAIVCGTEPDPCLNPEISVSLVDANAGAIECVEEGGQYYVLVELTGGSGNDSYSLHDGVDVFITEFTSGSNYLAGPYNEGDSVSFTAIGNQDDECSVTSDLVDPDTCEVEPDPCLNPEIFVSLVDANSGAIECVEEGGQYYVLVELTGGSGNDSYSLYDGGDALTTEFTSGSNYLAGPYDEGDSVSFTAIGNQDEECSVTSDLVDPDICEVEPDPCLNPEIFVSLVDANAGAIECVEEGGQYYVLVELTGGSGNDTYSLYDGGDALTTEFTSGSNYLAGPYDEGDSVSFTAIGNQDDECSVTSDLVDPDTCEVEPDPCLNPEISVSLVDANAGAIECVEEGGQYYVLVELTGGSGNDSYSLYDGGDALTTEFTSGSNYLAGPYNEGDSVSFTAIGNQDDECSVTSDLVNPDTCEVEPDPCLNPEISVSLVDANAGAIECVEEGGQYYVLVELTGGSGNDSYSLYDGGDALTTEFTSGSNYLAGPYDEGDSVSFTVIGNQDDECSVTSDLVNPDTCEVDRKS